MSSALICTQNYRAIARLRRLERGRKLEGVPCWNPRSSLKDVVTSVYRPAVFDDIPITAIVTMETVGTGTRYVFTALHRDEADFEKNKASGWQQGTEIALDQFVAHVKSMK